MIVSLSKSDTVVIVVGSGPDKAATTGMTATGVVATVVGSETGVVATVVGSGSETGTAVTVVGSETCTAATVVGSGPDMAATVVGSGPDMAESLSKSDIAAMFANEVGTEPGTTQREDIGYDSELDVAVGRSEDYYRMAEHESEMLDGIEMGFVTHLSG